ncbi:hypothetical protein D3C80_1454470 [compost metagenome]
MNEDLTESPPSAVRDSVLATSGPFIYLMNSHANFLLGELALIPKISGSPMAIVASGSAGSTGIVTMSQLIAEPF